jgi:hypothetical protein
MAGQAPQIWSFQAPREEQLDLGLCHMLPCRLTQEVFPPKEFMLVLRDCLIGLAPKFPKRRPGGRRTRLQAKDHLSEALWIAPARPAEQPPFGSIMMPRSQVV